MVVEFIQSTKKVNVNPGKAGKEEVLENVSDDVFKKGANVIFI